MCLVTQNSHVVIMYPSEFNISLQCSSIYVRKFAFSTGLNRANDPRNSVRIESHVTPS